MSTEYRGFNVNNVPPLTLDQQTGKIEDLASWGANIVRWQLVTDINLASTWTQEQYEQWLEGELSNLDSLIPVFTRLNIAVIVDLHTPVGGQAVLPKGVEYNVFLEDWARSAFLSEWTSIAKRYADTPCVLGYDLLNEPAILHGVEPWQDLAQAAAENIRAVDSQKIIIMEAIGSDARSIKKIKPLQGVDPVWYSVHMYYPSGITFQGIPDANCNMTPIGNPYPGGYDKSRLENYLSDALNFQKTYNVPIYVGEYSCARWSGYPDSKNAYNYLNDCIEIFEEYGWNWTYHAFREAGVWNLEYSDKPCPDKCNAGCTEPDQDTDRKELMVAAFKKNSQ